MYDITIWMAAAIIVGPQVICALIVKIFAEWDML